MMYNVKEIIDKEIAYLEGRRRDEESSKRFVTYKKDKLREAYLYLHSKGIIFYGGQNITTLLERYLDEGDLGFRLILTYNTVRVLRVTSTYFDYTEDSIYNLDDFNKKTLIKRGEKL